MRKVISHRWREIYAMARVEASLTQPSPTGNMEVAQSQDNTTLHLRKKKWVSLNVNPMSADFEATTENAIL